MGSQPGAGEPDHSPSPEESQHLVDHAGTAPDDGGDGCSFQAEFGERPETEDETGIEDQVHPVGDPERPHGHLRVTGATEDRVVDEEEHDHGVAAERDSQVFSPERGQLRGGSHERQKPFSPNEADDRDRDRDQQAEPVGLDRRPGCDLLSLLPDPPGHKGGSTDRQTEADGVYEVEEGLGEPHDGHGVGAEPADEEDVGHGEDRLHRHLQDHGDGQDPDRPIQVAVGED